jgi:hypothetical protein
MLVCLVVGAGRHGAFNSRPMFLMGAVFVSGATWYGLIQGLLYLLRAFT